MGNFAENLNLGNRFRPPPWNEAEEAGRAQFNFGNSHVRDRCIQRCVIYKQNSFKITSRGVQRWTSTDFLLK